MNCIQKAMADQSITAAELSRRSGVPYGTVYDISIGKIRVERMAVENFLKIAHGLGMTAEELYYGEKQPIAYADEREADMHRIWGELDEERRGRLHSTAQDMELAKSNEDSAFLEEVAE